MLIAIRKYSYGCLVLIANTTEKSRKATCGFLLSVFDFFGNILRYLVSHINYLSLARGPEIRAGEP